MITFGMSKLFANKFTRLGSKVKNRIGEILLTYIPHPSIPIELYHKFLNQAFLYFSSTLLTVNCFNLLHLA